MKNILLLGSCLGLLVTQLLGAEAPDGPDWERVEAPYFSIRSADPTVDCLPLKATAVDARIAGVVAEVNIRQTYQNTGKVPLEAIYIFPGSTRAAVHGLTMTIGERRITAQIQRKQQAQATFDKAKSEGKSASLLQQHRPNVFQMSVANIQPGDTISVELAYTEMLVPESGQYQFVFPTVVGPRYSGNPENAGSGEQWVKNPYLAENERTTSDFALKVDLQAGMPLLDLQCATHRVQTNFLSPKIATVQLDPVEPYGGNRDFILKYRLADAVIESGLILSHAKAENFFLLTVQPPKRLVPADLPPRDYLFVVDVSGSMEGFPLDVAKTLLTDLLRGLSGKDSFNVLLFSGGSRLLSPESLSATPENLQKAIDILDRERAGGGTELLPALQKALNLPNQWDAARSIVVITDGFVSADQRVFDLIRSNLKQASLFSFGIGSSINRFLIEGMARAGQGEPFMVTRAEEAPAAAKRLREIISSPVLTHIDVKTEGFTILDQEPASVPDLLAERPVMLVGRWKGERKGSITVSGKTGGGRFERKFAIENAELTESPVLGRTWARTRIGRLSDDNTLEASDQRIQEVTHLGLNFHLLTAYTSFVAVDELVHQPLLPMKTVNQPLPLPQGVSGKAVASSSQAAVSTGGSGMGISTTPEPETWALLLVTAGVFAFHFIRWKRRQA